MAYSLCDPGNFFVIPGSPEEAWMASKLMVAPKEELRLKMDYRPDDFVVAIVGSQLQYRGLWLEHALVLQALHPLLADFRDSSSHLKIVILSGDSASNYSTVAQVRLIFFPKLIDNVYLITVDHTLLLCETEYASVLTNVS